MERLDNAESAASDVTSLRRCRELLGEEAAELSDKEIDQIRGHAELLAHAILELYLEQQPTIH